MKSRAPLRSLSLFAVLAGVTTLAILGGPRGHEALLCLLLIGAFGLLAAVAPIVGLALLLRTIQRPLDAAPEYRLRTDHGDLSAGTLGRHPTAV